MNKLKLSLTFGLAKVSVRSFAESAIGPKRKYPVDPTKADELPIFDYTSKKPKKRRVYVWGRADAGALGLKLQKKVAEEINIKTPKRFAFAEYNDVVKIACGYNFTAFAVNSGDQMMLYGTGVNTDGQIGYHEFRPNHPLALLLIPQPIVLPLDNIKQKIVDMSAGRAHLLILTEHYLFSLGNNSFGQCGRGIVKDEDYSRNQIVHQVNHVPENIISVKCGHDHSLMLTDSGKIYACGWGADGQTGLGHYNVHHQFSMVAGDLKDERIVKISTISDCNLALSEKGEVFGWGNSEYKQIPNLGNSQQINFPIHLGIEKVCGRIIDIAVGGSFCIVLNENHDVFVWGFGLLGKGPALTYTDKPTQIPGELFGRNVYNQDVVVTSIAGGIGHLAAINNKGDLFLWGKNKRSCLGLGHQNDQYFPFKVSIPGIVESVSCGYEHTVAMSRSIV